MKESPTHLLGAALAALLVLASLGEGGATPLALLLIHAAVVGLLLACLAGLTAMDPERRPAARALAFFLAFLALGVAGAVAAPYGYAAYLVLLEQAVFLAVAVLAARCGAGLPARAAGVVLWGAAAQGALAAFQRFVLGVPRPAGTFLNPNHLGGWLVAAGALGLASWEARPTLKAALLRVIAAGFAALGLFLCGSRGALVGLAASLVFLLAAHLRSGEGRRRRWALVAGAGLLMIPPVLGVALRLARGPDPFLYHRLRIWQASLGAVASAPWTGTGPGQFDAAAANLNFALDEGPLRFERSFTSPHSDLLRLPSEFGWPATAVLLLAIVFVVADIRRQSRGGELPASALGAKAALVGLAAQAVVDDLTDRPAIYLLVATLLGSLLSVRVSRGTRFGVPFQLAASTLLVGAFTVGDLGTYLAWHTSRGLPRGRIDPRDRERLLAAISRNPLHPDLWLRRAEDLAGDGSDWEAPTYALSRETAERAIRLQPSDSRYRLGLARIEALACTTLFRDEATRARAAAAYNEAEALARHNPFLPLEQGRFLLATGDAGGARRAAERALAIEPQAVPARLLLSAATLVEGGAGNVARSQVLLREAEEVARRFRDWPRETPYARALLGLDPRWARSIRDQISEWRSVDSRGPSP